MFGVSRHPGGACNRQTTDPSCHVPPGCSAHPGGGSVSVCGTVAGRRGVCRGLRSERRPCP